MKTSLNKLEKKLPEPETILPTSSETELSLATLSQDEILSCINYVVDYLAPGFIFYPMDIDDIKQEGRQAAFKVLGKFNPNFKKTGTIEDRLKSFLFTHVRNRLINFKRDVLGRTKEKHDLNYASSIYGLDESHESQILIEEDDNFLDIKFIKEKILRELDEEFRHDFHKMMSGLTIPKAQKDKLLNRIREIVLNE